MIFSSVLTGGVNLMLDATFSGWHHLLESDMTLFVGRFQYFINGRNREYHMGEVRKLRELKSACVEGEIIGKYRWRTR